MKDKQEHSCGCGHDHGHQHHHEEGCGCGHDHGHQHHHDEGCGCGHHHEAAVVDGNLTDNQRSFLRELAQRGHLPVAQFLVKSSAQPEFESVALQPVFIRNLSDSMDEVKMAGAFLAKLEKQGMLTLDYDIPLKGYEYAEYKSCALYGHFCDTVAEGKGRENFWGDTADLALGSMALTTAAKEILG